MYLKTVSLAGFKSFADRTRLQFERGVTVVVGPNGSGKSNLLDALAWVLGTQATRSLRTERMEDVIFAGTATRPSLGRAEVSVTFDNDDGFLPIDLSEVVFTRRLYRDGTSEYELNGTACRLLDLQELLSDGGVGRHQHVLVGQGQIGEILNARPDEHRAVIEEAAGVTKHRSRRDRAIRRLEHTAQDVTRLEDILLQQRRRMRPLRRQAAAAERHDAVKAEVKALRLWIGGEALRRITSRMATAGAENEELASRLVRDQSELGQLRVDLDALRSTAGKVGRDLERSTAAAARLETSAERLQRIAMVARERRMSLQSRLDGADERKRDLVQERRDLAARIEEAYTAERRAEAMAERREEALSSLEDEERTLAEQINLPAESVAATLRGDLRALETAEDRDRRERERVEQRVAVVNARQSDDTEEADRVEANIRAADVRVAKAQDGFHAAHSAREEAQRTWEEAETRWRDADMARATAAARVEALEAALAGLGDPEAKATALADPDVMDSVVAKLDVPEALASAVDAALGMWSDSLATADAESLNAVTHRLKSLGLGGVALVAIASESTDPTARAVAADWGVEALVDRLGPGADPTLAGRLLGDVVLVEGWSTAWGIVQRFPGIRAVTPEGDAITARGIRLADADGAGPVALESATVALETADTELARAQSLHAGARRTFEVARDQERLELEQLESLEAELAGATEALGLLRRSRAEADAELERLHERLRSLDEAVGSRRERIGALRFRVAEFEGEEAVRQEAWEALNRRREEVAKRRDEARRAREEAAAQLASTQERRRILEQRVEATADELTALEQQDVDPAEIGHLESVEAAARVGLGSVRRHVDELRARQRELRAEGGLADGKLDAAHRRERQLEDTISEAKERSSALAIELAELRVRHEAEAEGLRRDADATEEQALAAPRPDVAEDADPRERLEALEADLRRMGAINPLAAAEYRELSDSVELLESQLADLADSQRELHKVIAALDEEMSQLFTGAFDAISTLFEEHFGVVFPGGRGRLVMTDPSNPLTTGVEIEAQPHGKKVGRLSLLSGGERSLAALAFLFAVFRARPSPFYVLDEVEAALDDANLRRFLRLVDMLRDSAQLVIITHQQQTMEAADILYGVTMEPGESSKVLAKRLHEAPV